jgi:hypothetical protein
MSAENKRKLKTAITGQKTFKGLKAALADVQKTMNDLHAAGLQRAKKGK